MPTKKSRKTRKTRKTRKVSKRVQALFDNPTSVWGKNKELEAFWQKLASGETVVLIYKDKTHKIEKLPKRGTTKLAKAFEEFNEDDNIKAVLTSAQSQDSYELYLYPKAKDKTVAYVIENYTKYFKPFDNKLLSLS
jgi:hypothetical protein